MNKINLHFITVQSQIQTTGINYYFKDAKLLLAFSINISGFLSNIIFAFIGELHTIATYQF